MKPGNVTCPGCGAKPGLRCRTPGGGVLDNDYHADRLRAAADSSPFFADGLDSVSFGPNSSTSKSDEQQTRDAGTPREIIVWRRSTKA